MTRNVDCLVQSSRGLKCGGQESAIKGHRTDAFPLKALRVVSTTAKTFPFSGHMFATAQQGRVSRSRGDFGIQMY